MGGCESCASSRRKEVERLLEDSMVTGNVEELRLAIKEAEENGVDSLRARKAYAELERKGWQSPEHIRDMMKWAMSTQDGAILYNITKEVSQTMPDSEDLRKARSKLKELHEEIIGRMQRFARNHDTRSLLLAMDRARHIGVPAEELAWADEYTKVDSTKLVRQDKAAALGRRRSS
mmetsp:Transcript_73621/g.170749  ORF Transcript_73621/g.170749 Transcript_73621/m.170749 type:complete len:176 (-) Transcript_73621:81-608(-)